MKLFNLIRSRFSLVDLVLMTPAATALIYRIHLTF
jgi:hypothetical protein